jgi:hypothetical protein
MVIKKIKSLVIMYNHNFQFFWKKSKKSPIKLFVIGTKTQQFFEVFEIPQNM